MSDIVLRQTETLTIIGTEQAAYPLEAAAELTGVHGELLRKYCELGLLGADRTEPEGEPTFDEAALYEVRRIEHFRREFGANLHALPLICGLVQEVERLRAELRYLRDV